MPHQRVHNPASSQLSGGSHVRLVAELGSHSDELTALQFSPDGSLLATASYDDPVVIWDVARLNVLRELELHPAGVTGLAFSSDSLLLAVAFADGSAQVWTRDGELVDRLPPQGTGGLSVAFSPASDLLAAVDGGEQIYLWDLLPSRLLASFPASPLSGLRERWFPDELHGLAFSPNGQRLAVICHSKQGQVQVWEISQPRPSPTWVGAAVNPNSQVYDLTYAPDGTCLAVATESKIEVYDPRTLNLITEWAVPGDIAVRLSFSPDGILLAAGGGRGKVWIWSKEQRQLVAHFVAHSETISWAINGMAWSPTGELIATGGWSIVDAYRTKHSRTKSDTFKGALAYPVRLWHVEV